MTPIDLHDELELALRVADAADLFTLPHFVDRDFTVDWKHNQTEVTEIRADLSMQQATLAAEMASKVLGRTVQATKQLGS